MNQLKRSCVFVVAAVWAVLTVIAHGPAWCSGYSDVSNEAQRTAEAVVARHPELSSDNALMEKMLSIVNHYERFGNTRSQSILRAESDMIRNGLLSTDQDRRRNVQNLGGTGGSGAGVIESRIDGEFKGWEGETIVKLNNGQIWQQAQYHHEYRYAYMPKAIIFINDGRWSMLVDGTQKAVPVSRLK